MAKTDNSQLCAILSYLLIGIIWYLIDEKMKKSDFAKFHVKQGVILLIFAIIWGIIISILAAFASIIPLFYLHPFIQLLNIVPLVFVIIGIINALNNKKNELPIIGEYAKKLTF
jgi:uncharacterized membrane protein